MLKLNMTVPAIIRKTLFPFLGLFGYRVAPVSNLVAVENFLASLHPVQFELIRVGSEGDGGYVIPNDLNGITACFSPGVSNNSEFELDLAHRGIPSFLADFSVSSPSVENRNFSFLKKFVGPVTNDNFVEFENWVTSNSKEKDELILQMDIEGYEYSSLLSCDFEVLKRFRILVIEFHGMDLLFDSFGFQLIEDCFKKILKEFVVVHIHPNNNDPVRRIRGCEVPSLMEFSFLRRDRISKFEYVRIFPNSLDRPTVPNKKDIVLPQNWYKAI